MPAKGPLVGLHPVLATIVWNFAEVSVRDVFCPRPKHHAEVPDGGVQNHADAKPVTPGIP